LLMALQHEERKKTCLFTISKSNITFEKTDIPDVVVNINAIVFENNEDDKEISVNEESRELICVGNSGNNTIKVQFSTKENCYKYTIRTSPNIATIPKGKAIEFEVFLKPLCSCQIDDIIVLISSNLKKGEISNMHISIKAKTQLSTQLDPDELEEDKKLGEGSFGIVYKGTFRSNTVAIKKMKQFTDDQKSLDEFEKEVDMLDKFRCDYIVHFYGAVFMTNKICLVTEFAEYGSLQDLMKHKQSSEVDMQTRLKMMLDSANGIVYLHINGILHRDIKPDNFLVFSLNKKDKVNAKLTDFGSARNVNLLTTNMTFTKGVGTPKYMAPEILNREKYKKEADVYSFAVTMFECFKWGEIYPKKDFQFAWSIADFVSAGKRVQRDKNIPEPYFEIIKQCWTQKKRDRVPIESVVEMLNNEMIK
ncbi:protein kinase, putative, partial [Entamoeba invadens IP1]